MGVPEVIGELVKRHGGLNKTSRKLDIPATTLSRMINGERVNPTLKTIQKVAAGLGWSPQKTVAQMLGDGGEAGT